MSINNVEAFAAHFNVEQCYTSNVDAALWFDFGAKADGRSLLGSMRITAVTRADTIAIGKTGRPIDVMRLLLADLSSIGALLRVPARATVQVARSANPGRRLYPHA